MAKCTNCGREIDRLNGYCKERARHIATMNKNGKELNYRYDKIIDSDEFVWITFECPFCHEEVANSEKGAIAFLQGGGN